MPMVAHLVVEDQFTEPVEVAEEQVVRSFKQIMADVVLKVS
jgi:hypothetical protein